MSNDPLSATLLDVLNLAPLQNSRAYHDFARTGRQGEFRAAGLIGVEGGGEVKFGNEDFARPGSTAPIT